MTTGLLQDSIKASGKFSQTNRRWFTEGIAKALQVILSKDEGKY